MKKCLVYRYLLFYPKKMDRMELNFLGIIINIKY